MTLVVTLPRWVTSRVMVSRGVCRDMIQPVGRTRNGLRLQTGGDVAPMEQDVTRMEMVTLILPQRR